MCKKYSYFSPADVVTIQTIGAPSFVVSSCCGIVVLALGTWKKSRTAYIRTQSPILDQETWMS